MDDAKRLYMEMVERYDSQHEEVQQIHEGRKRVFEEVLKDESKESQIEENFYKKAQWTKAGSKYDEDLDDMADD